MKTDTKISSSHRDHVCCGSGHDGIAPPPIRQLVFFGNFLWSGVAAKKHFWLDSAKEQENLYRSLILVENGEYEQLSIPDGLRVESAPEFFVRAPIRFRNVLVGVAAAVAILLRFPRLACAIGAMEYEIFTSRMSRRRLPFMPLHALSGLGLFWRTIRKICLGPGDVVVLWGQNLSGQRLLARIARGRRATVLYSEGGDLQGSIFVSETKMLHEAWPRTMPEVFASLPVAPEMRSAAQAYLDAVVEKRYSIKEYGKKSVDLARLVDSGLPLVYVNGVENFASGLRPGFTSESHKYSPEYRDNRSLLLHVLELAESNGWHVLYKDHPNTIRYNCNAALRGIKHPRLTILPDLNIHTVLEVCHVTVTRGSKVVLLSLSRNVPVVLVGPFSVAANCLDYGLVEDTSLEDGIMEVLARPAGERVDRKGLVDVVARLMGYYVYGSPNDAWTPLRTADDAWNDICDYLQKNRQVVSCDFVGNEPASV